MALEFVLATVIVLASVSVLVECFTLKISFTLKVFYVMGKALSGELTCVRIGCFSLALT